MVGIAKLPDESVPVTMMMYDPAGVPGVGALAPQAAWKATPANSMQAKAAAVNFRFLFVAEQNEGPSRTVRSAVERERKTAPNQGPAATARAE